MAKRIEVQIVGDASSLRNALNQAQGSTSKFGSALGTLAKTGALAAGAAGIGAVAVTLRQGIKEYTEASKVAAQTNAVLKSTGEVANVSAKQVDSLATSLMKKSGVDDEVIQSGENVLLSFTKIRNEVGKGNDIFNQATQAALDFSVRTGRDVPQAALLIGKALEDPANKLAGLAKAGIVFTDEQKKMAAAMVNSGNIMGAQQFVLKELEKRYGGAADAAGKTLPGQLNILKESFNNFAGDLVAKAVPALQTFTNWLNTKLIPAEGFTATLKVAWTGISEVAVDLWGRLLTAWEGEDRRIFIDAEKRMEIIHVEGLKDKLKAGIMEQINSIDWSDVLVAVGVGIGKGTLKLQLAIWQFLSSVWLWSWQQIISLVTTDAPRLVEAIITGIIPLQNRFRNTIQTAMVQGVAAITGAIGSAYSAAMNLGSRVVLGLITGLADLVGKLRGRLDDIPAVIRGLANPAAAAAAAIGHAIASGVVSGVSGLGESLYNKMAGMVIGAKNRILGLIGAQSPSRMFAEEVGVPIGQGITVGAADFLKQNLAPNLHDVLRRAMNSTAVDLSAKDGGTDIATTMKGGIDDFLEEKLPDNLAQVLGLAFDQATAGLDFSAAGLGVTWTTPTLPAPLPSVGLGPTRIADPDAGTIVVNNYAPIGSEQDLQNMVVSALAKVNGRGGLT